MYKFCMLFASCFDYATYRVSWLQQLLQRLLIKVKVAVTIDFESMYKCDT